MPRPLRLSRRPPALLFRACSQHYHMVGAIPQARTVYLAGVSTTACRGKICSAFVHNFLSEGETVQNGHVEERELRFEAGREALERGPGMGYADLLGLPLATVILVWLSTCTGAPTLILDSPEW